MEEHSISDPDALPTGTEEQDARIEKAIAENRWVKVGEYAEEWQRIILLSINGLGGLLKIIGSLSDGNTGAVQIRDGEQVEMADKMMFVDAMDNQLRRVTAVYEHLDRYDTAIAVDDKPIYSKFTSDIGLCMLTLRDELGKLGSTDFRESIVVVRNTLIESMQKAGFVFSVTNQPFIGERYDFENELLYVCKGPDPPVGEAV